MRLFWITVPAGLALACFGGLMLLEAKTTGPIVKNDPVIEQPRHWVTPQMTAETAARSNKLEPTIQAVDTKGNPVTLGSRNAERPQFVYFVLDGCPCSYDAEPLFHDLYKQFGGKVDFVSVTDAGPTKAKQWTGDLSVPYPVISDPKLNIIHAYGAVSSIYSALITREGHIAKMWPGYSADILREMNSMMAKLSDTPEKPFNTKYAPIQKATGCAFNVAPEK